MLEIPSVPPRYNGWDEAYALVEAGRPPSRSQVVAEPALRERFVTAVHQLIQVESFDIERHP